MRAKKEWHNGFALILCAISFSAQADLPDPTRPPIEANISTSAGGQAVAPASAPDNAGVRSIIISPTRRAAIINGKMVEQGAKYGDATLIEVNENGVVLQGSQGKQREMALFPGVGIKKKMEMPETEAEGSSGKPALNVAGASGVSPVQKKKTVKKKSRRIAAPEKKEGVEK